MRRPAWCLPLVAAVLLSPPVQGETYEVWPGDRFFWVNPVDALSGVNVGETFCYPDMWLCVVLAETPVQKANLDSLDKQGVIKVVLLPRARKIELGNGGDYSVPVPAIWDPETKTWDRSIPGLDEIPLDSPQSLFAVLFKSYPNVSSSTSTWLKTFVDVGYVVGGPTSYNYYRSMSYYIFGRRDLLPSLLAGHPEIRAYVEVPAGLKRIDSGNVFGADPTLIRFMNVSTSEVKRRFIQRYGTLSPHCSCGTLWFCYAWDSLTSAEALDWSRIPEVIGVYRRVVETGPGGGPSGGGGSSPVDVPALGRFGLMALLAGIAFAAWRILRR